jgi:hypothetical protein
VLLSGRDFHPTVGAYFQAHSSSPFGALQFGHFETAELGEFLDFSLGSRFFVFLLASEFRSV